MTRSRALAFESKETLRMATHRVSNPMDRISRRLGGQSELPSRLGEPAASRVVERRDVEGSVVEDTLQSLRQDQRVVSLHGHLESGI